MIGRLQTERDKDRLLDGMTAAAGTVDVGAVGDTISGLGKREFVLRRAGKDKPEVFTTRWAMSYLRGPADPRPDRPLMAARRAPHAGHRPARSPTGAAAAPLRRRVAPGAAAPAAARAGRRRDDRWRPTWPSGTPVRWVDAAAPWLREVGADPPAATASRPAAVARVRLRFDDEKADLVVDDGVRGGAVPASASSRRVDRGLAVDYDDRDLRAEPPDGAVYVLPDAPMANEDVLDRPPARPRRPPRAEPDDGDQVNKT